MTAGLLRRRRVLGDVVLYLDGRPIGVLEEEGGDIVMLRAWCGGPGSGTCFSQVVCPASDAPGVLLRHRRGCRQVKHS